MIININIKEKRPGVVGAPVIVCGNADYSVKFTFDADWDGLSTKTARFVWVQDGVVKYKDVEFTGDTVEVPVLINTRQVQIGVYAGDLCTSTPARIPCELSIRCGSGVPVDPEPEEQEPQGIIFEDIDESGKPTKLTLRGVTTLNQNQFGGGVLYGKVTHIDTDVAWVNIPNQAFASLTSLTNADNLIAGAQTITNSAFVACMALTELTFRTTPAVIGATAFMACTNIKTIRVPWAEGAVANAPWGATSATIIYNYTGEE